jgi:outer membrane lipoprotein
MNHLPFSSTRHVVALLLAIVAWLTGCASVPEPLRGGPQQSPDPAMVRTSPEQYAGMTVRWGGVIVTVENEAAQSVVQVVSRPLGESTRPLETDESWGRFIVRINGFIDPVDYAAGREITVIGVIDGVEQHNIGTYRYNYPLVRATTHYLWPVRLPPMPDPYFYSPFYSPWYPYPYGYYPY